MNSCASHRRTHIGVVWPKGLFLGFIILLLIHSSFNESSGQTLIRPFMSSDKPLGTDLAASKPLSLPGTSGPQFGGGSDNAALSSDWLRNWMPTIPNLQFSFNYLFGRNLRQSWWSADYTLPITLTTADMVFGEAHVNSANSSSTGGFPFLNNFWQQGSAGIQNRIDLSLGLGYRKFIGSDYFVGAYGFYDSTRLSGSWRSAGSLGIQAAMNGPGDSTIDLTVNYYSDSYVGYDSRGSVFPTFNLFGAIAEGRGNYDFEVGASQPLFNRSYDLRFKLAGYQYDMGNSRIYGLRSGADVTTADGVLKISADYGNDKLTGQYGQIGAYVNIGFQVENLLKGESPFTRPEPIFRSPRNLRQFASQPVKRNWRKPSAVIANANCTGLPDDSTFETPMDLACFYSSATIDGVNACNRFGYLRIEDTPGGQWTGAYADQWTTPPLDYRRDKEPMFMCSSAAFARMAKGVTHAYIGYRYWPTNNRITVFWITELPILQSNPNVTSILVYTNSAGDLNNWVFQGDFK